MVKILLKKIKKIATRFVEANMNNLNTNYPEIYFYNDYKEINI